MHQVLSEHKVRHISHPMGIIAIYIRQVSQTNTNPDSFPKCSGHLSVIEALRWYYVATWLLLLYYQTKFILNATAF